ncbi:uncharacterized protein LOC142465770 [Ascaphus truei]|uniref:uncharacterized protein LOC142465770 n=1 Tax=Ascaphus truei TaxID=8439 RepID=UPI003F597D2B
MGPPPHIWTGSDRVWSCRWLEVTVASLRDLQVLRLEAEERVRRVLIEEKDQEEAVRPRKSGPGDQNQEEMERVRPKRTEPGQNQEEVVRPRKSGPGDQNQEEMERVRPRTTGPKDRNQEDTKSVRPKRTVPGQNQEEMVRPGRTGPEDQNQVEMEQVRIGRTGPEDQSQEETEWVTPGRIEPEKNHEVIVRVRAGRTGQWDQNQEEIVRPRRTEPGDQNLDRTQARELPVSVLLCDPPNLHRFSSGSWGPRLKLGSSGVTSDLLFSRRMSGNCQSTPSSGFYEASDSGSAASSCSSLCSEAPSPSPQPVMSPHRGSALRPRSTDCTAERRRELRSARGGVQRPASTGPLDSYLLPSFSRSRYDIIAQRGDIVDLPDAPPLSAPPPLCVIQQRRRAEHYICKLALRYRCRPGAAIVLPDLGPVAPRNLAPPPLHCECALRDPPSPHYSSSVGDVRGAPGGHGGSWWKLLRQVTLRRDPRVAASEINLQQCGQGRHQTLQGQPHSHEGQLLRAKSFRDLLSINLFKRSQKENKV